MPVHAPICTSKPADAAPFLPSHRPVEQVWQREIPQLRQPLCVSIPLTMPTSTVFSRSSADLACHAHGYSGLYLALLHHGAHSDARYRRGNRPLFEAAVHGHGEVTALLMTLKRYTKETPHEMACLRSHVCTVREMLCAVHVRVLQLCRGRSEH